MSTSLPARIIVHVVAVLVLVHVATLIATPPSDDNLLFAWAIGPWEQLANVLPVAIAIQLIAAVVIVVRVPGDRRGLRVGLLIASAVIGSSVNAIVMGIIAQVTTTAELDVSPFALSFFITSLAGMVFVVAVTLAAALAEYALLPKPVRAAPE